MCLRSIIAWLAAGQHVREAKQKHACPWRAIRVSHERAFVRNRPRPVTRTWPTERVFTKRTRATEKIQVWPILLNPVTFFQSFSTQFQVSNFKKYFNFERYEKILILVRMVSYLYIFARNLLLIDCEFLSKIHIFENIIKTEELP